MRSVFVCLLGLLGALVVAAPATAAQFTVTRMDDPIPDESCPQDCSLREAVLAANARPGPDEVVLPTVPFEPQNNIYRMRIVGADEEAGATGDLDVTDDLTLIGETPESAVIDAEGLGDRVLHAIDASLNLTRVTVRGGRNPGSHGGGVFVQGENEPVELVLADAEITDNQTVMGSFGGGVAVIGGNVTITGSILSGNVTENYGGALFVSPRDVGVDVSVEGSIFHDNHATGSNGGAMFIDGSQAAPPDVRMNGVGFRVNSTGDSFGGALVVQEGVGTLLNVDFSNNQTGSFGGAFFNNGADLSLELVRFEHNRVDGFYGGGLYHTRGALEIVDTSFVGNASRGGAGNAEGPDGGGALYISDQDPTTALHIENVTFSENSAIEEGGAVLVATGSGGDRTTELTNVTFAGNTSFKTGDALYVATGTVILANTLLDGAGEDACGGEPVVSSGGNLDAGGTCGLAASGDQSGVDPRLQALGPDLTHALAADSPALDSALAEACPETDQRGVPRPLDGDGDGAPACDVGAYEAQFTDLSVRKEASAEQVEVGEEVTYALTVANGGPASASVTLHDTLPEGMTLTQIPEGCVNPGGIVICVLDEVGAGEERVIELVVSADAAGQVVNRASISYAETVVDADPGDDEASVPVTVSEFVGDEVERLSGADRVETAVETSRGAFEDGSAPAAVVARADVFPDALAGTPLAIAKQAPLLLSAADVLSPATEAELVRVLGDEGTVFLLGGTEALSDAVERSVTDLGFDVARYGGANRFATAVVIARDGLGDPATLLVASGGAFPDAISAGAAGGQAEAAVVLTSSDVMAPETQAYIDGRGDANRFAVGGPAAQADPTAAPLLGATRFETAIAVAEQFFEAPRLAGIATGQQFADGLAGGADIGSDGGPLLLSASEALPESVRQYLADNAASIDRARLYGGEQALSAGVAEQVASAVAD